MEKILAIALAVLLLFVAFKVARFFTRLVLLLIAAAILIVAYFLWLR